MAFALKLRMPQAVKRLLDSPRLVERFRPSYPPFAVEVTARRLVAVALARDADGVSLARNRVVDLPAGLVEPSLLRPGIADPALFARLLGEALDDLPGFEGRLSLVLPDRVAKITFVDMERLAPTVEETVELVRWKLKRSTPFRIEDGRIAFQAFPAAGGVRCLVSLVQTQVVGQYEEAVAALGFEAGLVDLSSFNLWNLIHDHMSRAGDVLLLNASDDQVTAVIGRDGQPLFVRCKSPSGAEPLGVEEVKSELHPTVLYYQDRIGGAGIREAHVRAPADTAAAIQETLATRYGIPSKRLDPGFIAGTQSLDPERLSLLAPALGAALGR